MLGTRRPRHQRIGLRPGPPDGLLLNILATFAEFEVGHLRVRSWEGMTVAWAKGANGQAAQADRSVTGPPRPAVRHQGARDRRHLAELFSVSRAMLQRALERARSDSADTPEIRHQNGSLGTHVFDECLCLARGIESGSEYLGPTPHQHFEDA